MILLIALITGINIIKTEQNKWHVVLFIVPALRIYNTAAVIAMAASSASTILTNPASLAFNYIILETHTWSWSFLKNR